MSNLCKAGATWSRGKWWIWALLGLLALFLLMLWFKWAPIEKDVQTRAQTALSNAGHNWAEVERSTSYPSRHGRDIVLSGLAPSETAKQQAIDTALTVNGVRVVNANFGLKTFTSPNVSMFEVNKGVVLTGQLSKQSEVDQIVASATGLYDTANVDNQLTISDDVSSAAWIDGISTAFQSTQSANDSGLVVNDAGAILTGMVRSQTDKSRIFQIANSALDGKVDNQLIVLPYAPASVSIKRSSDRITLEGTVQTQETADQLNASANKLVGASNVDNQLHVSANTAPATWANGLNTLLSLIADTASISANADSITVSGTMLNEDVKSGLLEQAASLFSGVSVIDRLNVMPPSKPASIAIERNNGRINLKGTVQSQQTADQLYASASKLVGASNVEKQLHVSANTSPATWASGLVALLPRLADTSFLSANAESITLSGTMSNDVAKSELLNQTASLFQGVSIIDQLKVKPPTKPASFSIAQNNGQITLKGTVQSQQTVAQLVNSANQAVGANRVTNQLVVVANTRPISAFDGLGADGLNQIVQSLPNLGQLSLTGNAVTLTGEMPNKITRSRLLKQTTSVFSGHSIVDQLSVTAPVPAKIEPVISAIQTCQTRLNQTMNGKKIKFATNNAEIGFESYPLLLQIIRVAKDCEPHMTTNSLEISGHTDDRGSEEYNLSLSARRAASVLDYLSAAGVTTSLLKAKGYGESQPISSNDTVAGRSDNRRIQFDIK